MRYFGLRSFGVIYGSIQPFTFALSISLGAYLLGWLYDRAEGYGTAEWVLLAAFPWLRAACSPSPLSAEIALRGIMPASVRPGAARSCR